MAHHPGLLLDFFTASSCSALRRIGGGRTNGGGVPVERVAGADLCLVIATSSSSTAFSAARSEAHPEGAALSSPQAAGRLRPAGASAREGRFHAVDDDCPESRQKHAEQAVSNARSVTPRKVQLFGEDQRGKDQRQQTAMTAISWILR
jgi:hypothetical protein